MKSHPIKRTVDHLIRELNEFKDSISDDTREFGSKQSDYHPRYFQHGDWDCEKSPTGNCMYTNHEYDSCIFCYEPDERK